MRRRRADWQPASSSLRMLLLAGATIVVLLSIATAGALEPEAIAVKRANSIIVAQAGSSLTHADNRCRASGCSREICVDAGEHRFTPCIWRPEYECYKKALCEVQSDRKCGWTMTPQLESCLGNSSGSLSGNGHQGAAAPAN